MTYLHLHFASDVRYAVSGCDHFTFEWLAPRPKPFPSSTLRSFPIEPIHNFVPCMAQDDDMVLRPRPTALKFDLIAKCSVRCCAPLGYLSKLTYFADNKSPRGNTEPPSRPSLAANLHARGNAGIAERPHAEAA